MVADLAWDLTLSDTQIWQREAIIVEVSVNAPNKFARLQAENFTLAGSKVTALPLRVVKKQADKHHRLSLRWRITPHIIGQKTIQLPTIRYSLNGANRVKWQPPVQTIDIQALPPYFPPTLPIGEVKISSHIEPKGLLSPDTLAYWHINLQSKHVTPEQFPPLLKQIKSNESFERFPAKLSVNTSFETETFKQDYLIPIKPKNNGQLDLPTLEWHWFNPHNGRLQKQQHQAPSTFVLSKLWQIIIGLLLSIITLTALYHLSSYSYHNYQRWTNRRKLRKALTNPKHIEEIRSAMMQCALVHNWPVIFSVKQWLENWDNTYGRDELLKYKVQKFEENCFKAKKYPPSNT